MDNNGRGDGITEVSGHEFVARLIELSSDINTDPNDSEFRIPTSQADSPLRVIGMVDLRGLSLRQPPAIFDVCFTGRVDLRNTLVEGSLSFKQCEFQESILFDDAEIEGSLNLSGISAENLNMTGVVLGGSLDLSLAQVKTATLIKNGRISGGIDALGFSSSKLLMPGCHIEGDLLLGCGLGGLKELSRIDLVDGTGLRLGGNLLIAGQGSLSNSRTSLNFFGARIAGNVRIGHYEQSLGEQVQVQTILGWVGFDYSRIEGYFWIVGVRSLDFQLTLARVEGMVAFEPADKAGFRTEIAGDLTISGLVCLSRIRFSGVVVNGSILYSSGETGTIHFLPALVTSDTGTSLVVPTQAAFILMSNLQIRGRALLSHVQVLGTKQPFDVRGVSIIDCTVDADLSLWTMEAFSGNREIDAGRVELEEWDFSTAIVGDLHIKRSRIGGDCNLTFAKVSGAIDLRDSVVKGDLRVACTQTAAEEASGKEASFKSLRSIAPMESLQHRTVCKKVKMRMLSCENDVDLTGLSIADDHQANEGNVDARYLSVKGDLLLCTEQGQESYAHIPGKLDLSYSRINRVVVSGRSFPPNDGLLNEECGIEFVRAEIGRLDIPSINDREDKFPAPINLEDIKVEVWNVGSNDSQQYIELLNNDPIFRRSSYRAIESNVRDRGQDDIADRVFRAMNDRDRREKFQRLRGNGLGKWLQHGFTAPLHYGHKIFLRFGTSAMPLALLILFFMVASAFVYADRDNFQPSVRKLTIPSESYSEGEPPVRTGAVPEVWGLSDIGAMILRYHVPVVSLGIRSDWEPRDKGSVHIWPLSHDNDLGNITGLPSPEDFTALMSFLNWIMWPILLTYLLQKALRSRQ